MPSPISTFCVRVRQVGFDLAGNEAAHPPRLFVAAFAAARAAGLGLTCHAGEGSDAAAGRNIEDAIRLLKVTRIGHAVAAKYHPGALAAIQQAGVVVETCPTSNCHTCPDLSSVSRLHAYLQLRQFPCRFSCDPPLPLLAADRGLAGAAALARRGHLRALRRQSASERHLGGRRVRAAARGDAPRAARPRGHGQGRYRARGFRLPRTSSRRGVKRLQFGGNGPWHWDPGLGFYFKLMSMSGV